MNIRLKELAEWRGKQMTPLPARPELNQPEIKRMSTITGLDGGLIQAALERAKQRLTAKTTEGVAKIEGATTAGEAKIDGVASNLAAKIEKEIEDQVSQFVTVTNGGPV